MSNDWIWTREFTVEKCLWLVLLDSPVNLSLSFWWWLNDIKIPWALRLWNTVSEEVLQQRFLKSRGLGPIKTKRKSTWALPLTLHQMTAFFRKWPVGSQQCLVVRNLGRTWFLLYYCMHSVPTWERRCTRHGACLRAGGQLSGLVLFIPRWIQGIELKLVWPAPLPAEPFRQPWFLSFT